MAAGTSTADFFEIDPGLRLLKPGLQSFPERPAPVLVFAIVYRRFHKLTTHIAIYNHLQ
jgi:hypothetical protein